MIQLDAGALILFIFVFGIMAGVLVTLAYQHSK